ncbi:MAG: NAD(P)H-dependent oxidoreductase [Syntrophorhabdus sp.]
MAYILVTYHSQTGNTRKMAESVASGIEDSPKSQAELKEAFHTIAHDIRTCDAVVFCSPEYFGYMSGAVKDLFDRTYETLKDDPGSLRKPYCIIVSAGNDGTGAVRQIERLCKGYRFKKVQDPIICKGPVTPEVLAKCRELGTTLAEGIDLGIF